MKLIMHDLSDADFKHIAPALNQENAVIGSRGKIRHCIGCYGCWIKTPGVCVIKDGYENIGQLFSKCDEMIVISKCVYGSYSPFIRNVWDRSIPYLLPYFVTANHETHHKQRYKNQFSKNVYFYGTSTEAEREMAERLVKANSISYNEKNTRVYFFNSFEEIEGEI
ncbi:flavodoxin family protein [Treponema endosymbiont of Eucomonympha sp.]|nr:flavodoxin family protein [Treponema endosymbiont of Eucomonympha sp.]